MSHSIPDKMVIQAFGFGPVMTARQSIQRAKKILLDLEKISPWRRPFNVSGSTEATEDMPIAQDLSDFEDVVMRALESREDVRYYSESDPDNRSLTLDSISPYGFGETFSDAGTAKDYEHRVSISLDSSGTENEVSLDDSLYNVFIRAYQPGEVNEAWSEPAVILGIFNYFIETYDPQGCVVYGRDQLNRIDTPESNYNMGWLNYTKDPRISSVFFSTGRAVSYRSGVLLKFGDDISVLSDPKTDDELATIRKKLRSVGVTI